MTPTPADDFEREEGHDKMTHEDMLTALNLVGMADSNITEVTRAVEHCPYAKRGFARDYAVRLARLGCRMEIILSDIKSVYGAPAHAEHSD